MLDQKIITQEGRRPNPIEHRGIFSFTNTAGRFAMIKHVAFTGILPGINHAYSSSLPVIILKTDRGNLMWLSDELQLHPFEIIKNEKWLCVLFFFQLQILRFLIMANPQKEDGYTAIANEIMEALAGIRISGEEWQCLCHILRKTYGWRKITDAISLSQFEDSTGIKKQNVCRALNRLLSKKIIAIIKKDKGITEYALQKDYETWEPLSKKITLSKKIKPVIKKDKEPPKIVIKKDTHKRKEYKTTITKEKRSRGKFSPPCIETLTMEFQKKGITGEAGKREAEKFFNHYESNGWMVGKNKMKSWPASVAGWVGRNKEREQKPKQKESTTQQVDDPDDHFEKEVK